MMKSASLTARQKQERVHRVLSLVNFFGFLAILLMDWPHMSFIKRAGFSIGAFGNLACFFFWKKWEKVIYPIVYALDAVLYATKGYGLHAMGSRRAYVFFYLVAGAYLILALFWGRLDHRFRKRHHP